MNTFRTPLENWAGSRQSRFGKLPFGDFDVTLENWATAFHAEALWCILYVIRAIKMGIGNLPQGEDITANSRWVDFAPFVRSPG